MADAVTTQKLHDGIARCVHRFTNVSDGTGESAVLKIDVSGLNGGRRGRVCTGISIEKIQYSVVGMVAELLWDADTDVVAAVLQGDGEKCFDPPMPNNSTDGKTGDLLLTTVGHTSGDTYDITIWARKKYA